VTRRRRVRTGAIVREVRAAGERIIGAIRQASAEQKAHREVQVNRARDFLRAALDEGTPRTVVLEPPVANDTDEPPESNPRM
jgi:hypothetical protein